MTFSSLNKEIPNSEVIKCRIAKSKAVISYYLQNREEVENYLEQRKVQREQLRQQIETRCNPQGIRKRLLARAKIFQRQMP